MGAGGTARRVGTWLLLAAALTGALAFSILRATLPSDGARVEFYGDAWTADGVRIAPIDAPAAGLQAGDVVQAVGGTSMEAWLRDVTAAAVPRPDAQRPIEYLARPRRRGGRDGRHLGRAAGRRRRCSPAGASCCSRSRPRASRPTCTCGGPNEPAATALMLCACGAAGSSLPWFLGTTVSDGGPGRAVPAPHAGHRPGLHAAVAGRPPPGPGVPDALDRRPEPALARPGGLHRRAGRLRGRHGPHPGRESVGARVGRRVADGPGRGHRPDRRCSRSRCSRSATCGRRSPPPRPGSGSSR